MATEEQDIQSPLLGNQEIHPSPRVLSILPMPDLVLFPRMIMPLVLWDEPAQKLVQEALFQDKIIGVLASRGNKVEGYGPENLFQVGTAAAILKMRKGEDDAVRLLVQGLYRFRVAEWQGFEPYFAARIDPHLGGIRTRPGAGGPGLQRQRPLFEDAGALTHAAGRIGHSGPGVERPPDAGRHHRRQPQHLQGR